MTVKPFQQLCRIRQVLKINNIITDSSSYDGCMKTSFLSVQYKKYILLFPISVLIGSVFVNVVNDLDFGFIQVTQNYGIRKVFLFILKERLWHALFIFLVCYSTIKDKLLLILTGYIGVCFGIIETTLLVNYRTKGILIFIVMFCLHNLVYLLTTIGLMFHSEKKWGKDNINDACIIVFGYILGVLIETVVSSKIIMYIW